MLTCLAHSRMQIWPFFSPRSTRDYYGQTDQDYTRDYQLTCSALVHASIDFEVVTAIPKARKWPVLVLGSAICLSEDEIASLETYLQEGGIVVAFGPTGVRERRASQAAAPWLERYAIRMQVDEPDRFPGFPPYSRQAGQAARCTGFLDGVQIGPADWVEVEIGAGRLFWSPGRIQLDAGELNLATRVAAILPQKLPHVLKAPSGWALRRFKDSEHIYLVGLPKTVEAIPHKTITNAFIHEGIVERIGYSSSGRDSLVIELEHVPTIIRIYSPDLAEPGELKAESLPDGKPTTIDLSGISRFFVIQIKAAQTEVGNPSSSGIR